MKRRNFEFELYRINLVQSPPTLFEELNNPVTSDRGILAILEKASHPEFKVEVTGTKNRFEWVVRDYMQYRHQRHMKGPVYGITIAKSVIETFGEHVTDTGIEDGVSESAPPLADTCKLFFYMARHLVAIERRSSITGSNGWRYALQHILKDAAKKLGYNCWIELEPVPRHEEIIDAFNSFQVLTRLRLILRLPNPEFSRYSKTLYDEMKQSRISEYLQDMKNSQGLNRAESTLPYAAIEIAAAGYKKESVTMEGIRNGRHDKLTTGGTAAQGSIVYSKAYVREMLVSVESQAAQTIISTIINEIDRISSQFKKDDSE